MKQLVEMEDSTFCQEVLAEEVKESLDLDVLCQLKEVPDEDDEVEDEEDEKEDAAQAKPVTSDMVNALAARLKTLSVENFVRCLGISMIIQISYAMCIGR